MLLDDLSDGLIWQRENDNVAAEIVAIRSRGRSGCIAARSLIEFLGERLSLRRVVVNQLDVVPACENTSANSTTHVACTNNRDCHF